MATSAVQDALDRGMFDRMRGQLPMMLRNANRVKVDTDRMFRKFMSSVRTDEPVSSWSRRNRKYLRLGRMIAPGYLYRDTQRILFCVDVSGSMMQADAVLECMTVMENAVDGLSIDLVYWDSVCSPVFSRPRTVRDMAIYGGGRTDPGCVLRKLGPELKRYDGLIFLTDCIFEWEEPACARKIMMLRTHGDHEFPAWCRYTDELRNFIGNG
jgi:predicted metal-dependent peptidase